MSAARGSGEESTPAKILAVGDPTPDPAVAKKLLPGPAITAAFEPLPGTKRELAFLARLFGPGRSLVLAGADATADRVRASVRDRSFRILHFATHGVTNLARPESSFLLLTPAKEGGKVDSDLSGALPVSEVFGWNLAGTDLVVLSACSTGSGAVVENDGVLGLARAFLAAGAKNVISSLWPVEDAATASLMEALYRNLDREGLPPDAALAAARKKLLQESTTAAPHMWAPFVIMSR